jgi:hypothetical protein
MTSVDALRRLTTSVDTTEDASVAQAARKATLSLGIT